MTPSCSEQIIVEMIEDENSSLRNYSPTGSTVLAYKGAGTDVY